MNLLDLAQTAGRSYKLVSSINGGEYHGPCPLCGGDDRFHIWPVQGEHGTFWCRKCGKSGDAVQYLIDIEGKNFPEACRIVGKEIQDEQEYQTPRFKKPAAAADFKPRETLSPNDAWQQHALKLTNRAHEQLLNNPLQLQWLANRGVTLAGVEKYRLGWNPGENGNDLYRAREAWGLDTVLKDKDKKKKLWLPIGMVIPFFVEEILRRIRIRIPEERRKPGSIPYYLVPGSSTETFVSRWDAQAWLIIEAELDAIAVDCAAGDLIGAMALGNNSAKPTESAHLLLLESLWIGNALDYDPKVNDQGKYENSGGDQWPWWRDHYVQAERHPTPVGKDPGDVCKMGVDLREWIKIGLPPILTLPKATPQPVPVQQEQDVTPSGADISASPAAQPPAEILLGTSINGKKYIIVPDLPTRERIAAENPGVAIFTWQEILKLKGMPKEAAEKFIEIKETFGPEAEIESVNWKKEKL